jgi:hypothetical protein
MGKNKSASGLTNFVQYDNQGNIFFVSGSNTLMSISSSGAITTTGVISGSNALSSSFAVSSSFALTGTTAATASSVSNLNQNVVVTGSLTTTGQIVAQTLNVQQVTSSIVFSSGSNIFGNSLGNTQQMTGSVTVTGSFVVATTATELQVGATGVTLGNVITDNHNVTGSVRISGSLSGVGATFSSTVDGTIINSTSNAFRFSGNNAISLVSLNAQNVVKINAAGYWGTQLVGANDQGILIDNAGKVGIGVTTLSGWDTTLKPIEIGTTGSFYAGFNGLPVIYAGANAYYNGGWKYASSNASYKPLLLDMGNGNFHFQNAATGTSGNAISWTSLMKLFDNGNIGFGTGTFSEGTQTAGTMGFIPNSSVSSGPLLQFAGNGRIRPASTGDRLSIEGNSLFLNPNFYTDVVIGGTGNFGTQTISVRSAWSAGSYGQVQFYTGTGNSTIRSSVPGNSTNGIQILTYSAASGDKITANFDGAGNVYNYNNTTTWQQTSDVRVKENINTISNALDTLVALNPVTFDYKQEFADKNSWNEDKKLNNIGFIAQEFETVFPKYVHSIQDTVGDEIIEDFKSIDTGHLVPYLIKAIQELKAEFDEYKATHP